MKKFILLFAILSTSFISSCSDDDSNDSTTPPTTDDIFTAKIDGVLKNFSVVNVNVVPNPEEGYTDLEITAHVADDPDNTFELNLTRDSGEVFFVQYAEPLDELVTNYFQPNPLESFTVNLTENITGKLKGTFSGTMQNTGNAAESVTVTEGNFTIYY